MYARIVGSIGLLIALPALALWLVEALGNTVLDFGLPVTTGSGSGTVRGIGPYPRETWHLTLPGEPTRVLNITPGPTGRHRPLTEVNGDPGRPPTDGS